MPYESEEKIGGRLTMHDMLKRCSKAADAEIRRELLLVIERERRDLANVLAILGEYAYRRLHRDEGYYSMFEYCLRSLGLDENSAYRRIAAARVIRQHPDALALIASGELTLTSILILSPVLTGENARHLFKVARGKLRRELEALVAGISPLPSRMDYVRRVPATLPAATSHDPSEALSAPPSRPWQAVMPISLDRVRIGFDAAVALMTLIERARQVLRHKYPEGRLEDLLTEALELLLDRRNIHKRRLPGPTTGSTPPKVLAGGRYIPARVKSAVWQRDDGRCVWRFEDGTPCGSREALEFDHVRPFARGGRSNDARNVRLLCRLHNAMAAEAAGLNPGRRNG